MVIGIADDEKNVLEAYEAAIKKLGHTAVTKDSIRRMLDFLKDQTRQIDILFLDHHFRDEEPGVSMISEITRLRPDLDIVVTTKQPLEPNFVQDIVSAGVGFFKKSVIDPVWLEMEISQRVNVRKSKIAAIQRRLDEFCERFCGAKEGFSIFSFFSQQRKFKAVKIESIERLENKYIYPNFVLCLTIQSGQTKEITQEESREETVEIKAGTTQELGLKFSDSAKFFGSKLGSEIAGKLKKERAITKKKKLQSSFKVGQKIQIPNSEHANGVRRKEFYRGILHEAYKITIKVDCLQCGSGYEIDVFVLVPDQMAEVAVAYDKKGMVLEDEDGRNGYSIWNGNTMGGTLIK